MKHFLTLIALSLLVFSCSSDVEEQQQEQTRQITFQCSNPDIEVVTRATLSDASLTDLYIFEGTTLLAHQTSTDAAFGSPKVTLTYGQHTLTFIASNSKDQTFSAGVWQTSKVSDVFSSLKQITIDGSTATNVSVELNRRNARLMFTTTDNVPSTVLKCHVTFHNHKSLDATLAGGSAFTYEATLDMTGKSGKPFLVSASVLTSSSTAEEDCPVMIEFLGAQDAVLYHYERTVKLKPNRATNLIGEYFGGGSIVTVNTEWDEQDDVPLFGE